VYILEPCSVYIETNQPAPSALELYMLGEE